MKFLIIHNQYSRTGGEEHVVATQKTLLENHGHTVIEYRRNHGDVGKFRSFFTAIRNRTAIRDIKQIVNTEHPDVAIIHNLFPVISAAILPVLKKSGVKTLMTLHNYRLVCPNGVFYTQGKVCEKCGTSPFGVLNCMLYRCEGSFLGSVAWANRAVFSRSYFKNIDCFMALYEFQADKIKAYSSLLKTKRFEIITNCINPATMPESSVPKSDFVGFVGRLSPEKGIDLLFRVAKLLPDTKFKVAGEKAKSLVDMDIPPNLELVGYLDRQQLADFYTSATKIIFTSGCYEGFPLTVIEAMYYRSTVVVPRWGPLPEMTDDGACGLLYEPNDAQDLADKILHNQDLGEQARRKVEEHYNSEQYYEKILRCL